MKPRIEPAARAAAVMTSLLLASTAANAHGITGEGLAYLALIFVAVPLVGVGALLWVVAAVSAPKERHGEPLTGWRKGTRLVGGLLLLLGVLLVGWLFPHTFGKEILRSHGQRQAEAGSAAEAQARRDAEKAAVQAEADAFRQCHASKGFVGYWLVRRPGADYIMGLYADGSFSIRDVFENDGGLRLVSQGRWHIEEKIVDGLRESADFVWVVPRRGGGEQRIAQRVLSHSREAFSLLDAKGDTVQYSKESGSPAPKAC